MSTTTKKPWTADELCRLPEGWRYEIDEGELVIMSPAGRRHSRITGSTFGMIWQHVRDHKLGEVGTGEVGVYLRHEPRETLRGIDVAFYSNERVKQMGDETGLVDVPPDLAVEVHDPSEPDLRRKVDQYLSAGVRSVWVVDPRVRTLTRHAPGKEPKTWTDPQSVVEEPVLPGFSCRLAELFGDA